MSTAAPNSVEAALEAVRHALDVSVGSTGPNHPLREAEVLLAAAHAEAADAEDRALLAALRDLSEQLHPYAVGDRLISFQAVEGLERYVGRTDVLFRLSQRSSAKPPSRDRPLRGAPRLLRNSSSGSVDEEPPVYPRFGSLGSEIDEDIYAEVLGVFALEARDQLRLLQAALRRTESEAQDYAARREVVKRLRSMKGSSALVGAEAVRLIAHAAEDLATVLLEGAQVTPIQTALLRSASNALESLALGDAAERSAVNVNELVEALAQATEAADTRSRQLAGPSKRFGPDAARTVGAGERGSVPVRVDADRDDSTTKTSPRQETGDAHLDSVSEIESVATADAVTAEVASPTTELKANEDRLREALAERTLNPSATWDKEQLAKLDQLVRELDETRALVDRRRYRFDSPMRSLRSTTGRLRDLAERARGLTSGDHLATPGDAEVQAQLAAGLTPEHLLRLTSSLEECAAELATCDLQLGFATTGLETDFGQLRRSIQLLKQRVGRFRQASLEGLARRLHGVVRSAAQARGKQVELVLEGFDRSLDQGLVEAIGDCLLCLIQNAVHHGIESPELRHLRGKPRVGVVKVSVSSLGPRLVLDVSDDGAGLDEKVVALRATERGLMSVGADRLSNQEAWALARRPGFSTASQQDGNGLDLVMASLHRVAGELSITSELHRGTRALLEVPTDLTLSRGLVVERNGSVIAVPSASVLRVMRLDHPLSQDEGGGSQETEGSIEFRGERFQVVDLAKILGVDAETQEADSEMDTESDPSPTTLLLISTETERRALKVDRVRDAGELAIYPSGPLLDRYPGVLGFALGEGDELLPVLDLAAVTQSDSQDASDADLAGQTSARDTVLVVDDVASVRRVVSVLLERLGVRTLVAADGDEALRLVEGEDPAPTMALIDVGMPEMSGLELTAALRDRGKTFPIYLFTSPATDLPQVDDLDVEGYVFKPLVRRELAALLERHRSKRPRLQDDGESVKVVKEESE